MSELVRLITLQGSDEINVFGRSYRLRGLPESRDKSILMAALERIA